jgi:hypothetical protein
LALDDTGKLVVIELKRDAVGSHADLQALRYAAFCSTMSWEDIVELYATFAGIHDKEEAERNIRNFVTDPKFSSKLDNQPRVILAAGGFDVEITSCVLWLRTFRVDVSCVEITPYRMPDGRIVLVPRVIIPLPEAKEYIVSAEKKEAEQSTRPKATEGDLLEKAERRGVGELLNICRHMKTVWTEDPLPVYGGSFLYSVTKKKGWRSLFGINVSGQRKKTPERQLDVWIPIKNLADTTGREESFLRAAFVADHFQLIAEEKIDLILRLSKPDDAQALVDRLQEWTSVATHL